jgi:hypothetical protein
MIFRGAGDAYATKNHYFLGIATQLNLQEKEAPVLFWRIAL